MRKLRIAAVLLCLVLGLCGCKKSGGEEKAPQTSTQDPASIWDQDPVAVLGDIEISYRELMIYLQSTRQEYEEQYGSEVWDYALDSDGTTIWDFVREMTLEQLIYLKIVCAQAESLNVSLTEDEVMDVNDFTAEYMEYFTEDEIAYYGITKELIQGIYTENLLAEKIYETVTLKADTDVADEEARQVKVLQIYIQTSGFDEDGKQMKLTEAQLEEKRLKAEEIYAAAAEAEDFKAFAQANTEDTDEIEVIFGKGDKEEAVVNAAFALKAGEMSELIPASDGYYILYCESETDEEATAQKKEEIIAARQKALFEQYYSEWSAQYEIQVNDKVWTLVALDPNAAAAETEEGDQSATQEETKGE